MEINFIKLIFTVRTEVETADPCHLFGIRRGFQELFRLETGCRGECGESECPYEQIFSQRPSPEPSIAKRYQKPPLPFAFDLPLIPPPPNRGSVLEIGLSLVGVALNHARLFINAVRTLFGGRSGPLAPMGRVIEVASLDSSGNRVVVYREGGEPQLESIVILSLDGLEKSIILPSGSVTLDLTTPLRIFRDGRLVRELAFPTLAMSLLRRMSAIAFYYSFAESEQDFGWLSRLSREVVLTEGDFRWVEWSGNQGGIVGAGTFVGSLTEFHPALLFGEFFHVGKGAAFGLGCYRLARMEGMS